MHILRLNRDTMELGEMDFLCCEMLQQIIPSANADDDPAVHRRLYSSPSGSREPEFDQDWKNYVEPDLRNLFRSSQEIVEGDLQGFAPAEDTGDNALRIPVKNLEAWIHTLNQARLAIAARYDFSERDMDKRMSLDGGARSLALFQIHFYGVLQECFLQQLD